MATTLQGQWNATYGVTPTIAQDDQTFTLFQQRVIMAAVAAAIAIGNEGTGTTNHANRVAFAKLVLQNPLLYMGPFAQALASQGLEQATASDLQITNTIAAIWNPIAGAL